MISAQKNSSILTLRLIIIVSILMSSLGCSLSMKENTFIEDVSKSIEIEGTISILAVDEIDPATGQLRGKFINYLQINMSERFILEPYSDSYTVPLRPNVKVKVFGIMKDKKILYKKIIPFRE